MNPQVSVVIVTYNSKSFIGPCLDSVMNSNLRSFEIIVVDNDSHDETVQFLRETYPTINLIESRTNLGFAGGVNLGLMKARGDYIFLLNPDTLVDADCTLELVKAAQEDKSIGALGGKVYYYNGKQIQSAGGTVLRDGSGYSFGWRQEDHGQFDKKREVEWIHGSAMMITRTALGRVGLFDPLYFLFSDETDWEWRARKAGFKIMFVPTALTRHFQGASSEKQLRRKQLVHTSRVTFVLKNYERGALVRWTFREGERFIGTLNKSSVLRTPEALSYLENLMYAYHRNFRILPLVLMARRRNRVSNPPLTRIGDIPNPSRNS